MGRLLASLGATAHVAVVREDGTGPIIQTEPRLRGPQAGLGRPTRARSSCVPMSLDRNGTATADTATTFSTRPAGVDDHHELRAQQPLPDWQRLAP